MTTKSGRQNPTPAQRWDEHEMLLEVFQMLNWGGLEFYIDPPKSKDEPGTLYLQARALPPEAWEKPREERSTSVTVVAFDLHYGLPPLVMERRRQEAEAEAETAGGESAVGGA